MLETQRFTLGTNSVKNCKNYNLWFFEIGCSEKLVSKLKKF